jgi:dihydroorotase-like cyclic amidohydrolase
MKSLKSRTYLYVMRKIVSIGNKVKVHGDVNIVDCTGLVAMPVL